MIARLRERLDSIRVHDNRPTVALVLGGGGAKGAAEVGAMKYIIDEMGIPVDMVCGTSIGALLGGVLALGYDVNYLDSLFHNQNWPAILSDMVDPSYIPYSRKFEMSRYQLSIPFLYENGSRGRLSRRLRRDMRGDSYEDRLINSLPVGYAYGLNVNNLFSSFSVGYQDSLDFSRLPVPYACVGADILSMRAAYLGSGSLKTAMRSSMSIPGVFGPVRFGDMVLADGGMRNNYPTDIAKAAGADYIIGIDLSGNEAEKKDVNMGTMLGRFISMLDKDAHDMNVPYSSVYIKPDVKGYNALSFSDDAVDTLYARGYRAAKLHHTMLSVIKSAVGPARMHLAARPAIDITRTSVKVDSVFFEGVKPHEALFLRRLVGIRGGSAVNAAVMSEAMSRLQATGAFESLNYELTGRDAPFDLHFNCEKAPIHEMSAGVRIDTEEWASVKLALGFNARKLMGFKFWLNGEVGQSQMVGLRLALDYPSFPMLNFEFNFNNTRGDVRVDKSGFKYAVDYHGYDAGLYLSNIRWSKFLDFKAGVRYRKYWFPAFDIGSESEGYYGAFLNANACTFDDWYFPASGIRFNMFYNCDFAKPRTPGYIPSHIFGIDFKGVIPCNDFFSIIPEVYLRAVSDRNEADGSYASLLHRNFIGGAIADRYFAGQVPFVGINNVYLAKNKLGVLNCEFRFKLVPDLYLSAIGGVFRDVASFKDCFSSIAPTGMQAAVQLGYNTVAGPLRLNVHWSDVSKWGVYASFGMEF